ncbi:MAG TPA: TonB-dependent receptor [Mucilaginibacter sp.]
MNLKFTKRMRPLMLLLFLFSLQLYSLAQAQTKCIGTVTNSEGSPLQLATVKSMDGKSSAITDAKGHFEIMLKSSAASLKITMVGYEPLEVSIQPGVPVRVVLKEQVSTLNEVVVIGYGTRKKKDLTGSVASISAAELEKTNPVTLEQGIQGKAAGVLVTQTDGAPGAGMSIQIRGTNSFLGGTEPLYVIDGVPMESDNNDNTPASGSPYEQAKTNTLSFLNPSDIQSIEILKDASATAIYGSRGANGVVIITTKKGTAGRDRIEFNVLTSISHITKKYDLLNAEQFANYQNEAYVNSDTYLGTNYQATGQLPYPGKFDTLQNKYLKGPADYRNGGTDWQNVLFQNAPKQDYTLTLSGGSDKNTYLISGDILNQEGIIINSKFRRYSIHANLDRSVKKWLQVGTSISYSNAINQMVTTGASIVGPAGGVIKSALTFIPTVPLVDPSTGQYTQLYFTSNPYQYAKQALDQVSGPRMFNSSYIEASILQGLKFRSVLGWNVASDRRDQYYPRTINEGRTYNGIAYVSTTSSSNVSSENYFTYDKKWGIQSLNATGGASYNNGIWQYQSDEVSGFMNDVLQDNNLGAASVYNQPASGKSDWRLISYYGRVNYILSNKYLFTATYRRDGSSKFATDNKWAGFTSGAIAWRLSEEKFLKNVKWLSNLKARTSFGQSGNQGIGSYSSLSQISASNYPYSGTVANGYLVSYLGNDKLKWETTNQFDGGLDIGLWNDKVSIVLDYYYKKTFNLLQYVTLPSSTGFSSQLENMGTIRNEGFEAAVNAKLIDSKNFGWSVSANISTNTNKILSLGGVNEQWVQTIGTEPVNYQPFVQRVGQPIGIIMGWKEDGIFQNEQEVRDSKLFNGQPDAIIKREVGEIRYKDINGDGVIDNNDRTIIGNVNPKFYYGFSTNLNYGNFDINIFFQGVYGGDIINTLKYITDNLGSYSNTTVEAYNARWTGPGSQGTNPKDILNSWRDFKFSNRFVENGSYLRLKNVNLGYTFNLKNKEIINSLRIFSSIDNLFTITKYSGYDPEVNGFGQDPSRRGVDLGNYPTSRTFSLGVNCSF